MSLSVDGVWKVGVWAQTVWADGVWREGEYVAPVEDTGGGGSRARSRPRRRIKYLPQLPVQQEQKELPGEEEEYAEPSVPLPVDQFGEEVDSRIILVNADIEALATELEKKQAQTIKQIQDFEDILLYL